VIHVYGIVEELEGLPPVVGVAGSPLERRRVDGLELVVSDVAGADVTQEAVLEHAQVVEGLMGRSGAVLPAQFGRPFGDEEELADAIRTKAEELARGLDRVRGCVELGLRVAGPSEDLDARSGTEYMRVRLAQEQGLAELHEPLARLSRTAVRGAYLVPMENVEAFREAVRRLQAENPELTIVCTGPWPPYSFGAEDA
jgi:Gas vesicle synthesis protein GvpL/GvpF